ncbi:MAG TPA: hypothetical protein VIF62_17465 [Labilithrix sp.]
MRASFALAILASCAEQSAVPPVPTGALASEPLPPAKPAPPPSVTPPPARQDIPTATPEELSVPGPLALPCRTDAQCGTHRCNVRYGKCAFPCATDADCAVGATCFTQTGVFVCIPAPP